MTEQYAVAQALGQSEKPAARQSFDARALTGASGIADLILDDKVYTLRITRAGKLILTK